MDGRMDGGREDWDYSPRIVSHAHGAVGGHDRTARRADVRLLHREAGLSASAAGTAGAESSERVLVVCGANANDVVEVSWAAGSAALGPAVATAEDGDDASLMMMQMERGRGQ